MSNFEDLVHRDKNRLNNLLKLLKNEIIVNYNELEIEDSETLVVIKIKKYNLSLDVTDKYVKVYRRTQTNNFEISRLIADYTKVTIDDDDVVIEDRFIIIRLKDFMITNNNKNLKRMFIVMQI